MRPKITCHMMSSIDGRLRLEGWSRSITGEDFDALLKIYYDVAARLESDGWIAGRKTMADVLNAAPRTVENRFVNLREDFIAERGNRRLAVLVDPSGKLHYGADNVNGDHAVAIVGEGVPDSYLAELRDDGVSYVFAGKDGKDITRAMTVIGKSFGVRSLVLEGGGFTSGAFLRSRLIDEFSILVFPAVDGRAGNPAIVEYAGEDKESLTEGLGLKHLATETLDGGQVWLRYGVEKLPN